MAATKASSKKDLFYRIAHSLPVDFQETDLDILIAGGYFAPITSNAALRDYLRYPGCNNLSSECIKYEEQLKTALDEGWRVFFNMLKLTSEGDLCNYKCLVILPPKKSGTE